MRFRGRALYAVLALLAFAPLRAEAGGLIVYEVRLGDSPIGTYSVQQQQTAGERRVATVTDLKVMLGPLPLHSYQQRTDEVWHQGELVAFTSDTVENGSSYRVEGRRTASGFLLEGKDGQALVEETLGTLSGLLLGIKRAAVIDAESGAIRRIRLSEPRRDSTQIAGRAFESLRQEVRGGVKADTWADDRGVLRMIIESKLATVEFLRQDVVQQAAVPRYGVQRISEAHP